MLYLKQKLKIPYLGIQANVESIVQIIQADCISQSIKNSYILMVVEMQARA